ncbi:MAG: LysE family translocator [Pseudomonadota bacterium]
MDFLPTLPVFLAFATAVFVLSITPGPDMIYFLGKAISQSRAAGFAAVGGAVCGTVVHTIMVAVGLSALLAASATAFTVLKVVGALYLAWLAIDALRGGSSFALEAKKGRGETLTSVFLKAIGINLLNPKIIVFFVTFLPQFVSADDPNAFGKLLFLGIMFPVIAVPIVAPMIIYADKIASVLKRSPKVARAIDYIFAGVLGAFAAKLLFTQAR